LSRRPTPRVWWLALIPALAAPLGCRERYRVGELVMVKFDQQECPGFITSIKSRTRFRVHFNFEGHEWDEDVSIDRMLGRGKSAADSCKPPAHVAAILGIRASEKDAEKRAAYKKGDKVRVRWRNSVYSATVIDVFEGGKLRIHYDGFEDAWDEIIPIERIVARK